MFKYVPVIAFTGDGFVNWKAFIALIGRINNYTLPEPPSNDLDITLNYKNYAVSSSNIYFS